jgi:hypothetical protein
MPSPELLRQGRGISPDLVADASAPLGKTERSLFSSSYINSLHARIQFLSVLISVSSVFLPLQAAVCCCLFPITFPTIFPRVKTNINKMASPRKYHMLGLRSTVSLTLCARTTPHNGHRPSQDQPPSSPRWNECCSWPQASSSRDECRRPRSYWRRWLYTRYAPGTNRRIEVLFDGQECPFRCRFAPPSSRRQRTKDQVRYHMPNGRGFQLLLITIQMLTF